MQPVLFIHIPKTGGTTLNHILSDQYRWKFMWLRNDIYRKGKDRILPIDIYWEIPTKRKSYYSAYGGHQTSELIPEFPDREKIMICRNPIDQIPSYYAHHRRNLSDSPSNLVIRKHKTLKDLLNSHSAFYPNPQVRNLFGNQIDQLSNEEIERKIAQLVSTQIDHCAPTERMHDFIAILAEKLKWRKKISYKPLNISPSKTKITEEEIQLIKDSNPLDFCLYREVQKKFEKSFAIFGTDSNINIVIDPSKSLLQFKIRNRIQQLITAYYTGFSLKRK